MKNDYAKYIIVICCFIVYAAGTESTNVECKVDHRGIILFGLNLPEGYNSWEDLNPSFYYKNDASIVNWREETDCMYVNKKKIYQCTMHELTNKQRSLVEKIAGYEFKLSFVVNTTMTNVTVLYFANNENVTLAPWYVLNKIPYCDDGYGVKYIAANASYNSINIEWILFPLDADSFDTFKSTISIKGVDNKLPIDKSTHCKYDFCEYNFSHLKPCTKYHICLETNGNLELEEERKVKCRYVHTYCVNTFQKNSINWEDTMLCVLGAILLIVCFVMLWALFNKHTKFGGIFNGNISEIEIVDQEDLASPLKMLNVNNIRIFHNIDAEQYHYPYPLVTALTSKTFTYDIKI